MPMHICARHFWIRLRRLKHLPANVGGGVCFYSAEMDYMVKSRCYQNKYWIIRGEDRSLIASTDELIIYSKKVNKVKQCQFSCLPAIQAVLEKIPHTAESNVFVYRVVFLTSAVTSCWNVRRGGQLNGGLTCQSLSFRPITSQALFRLLFNSSCDMPLAARTADWQPSWSEHKMVSLAQMDRLGKTGEGLLYRELGDEAVK